MGWPDPSGDKFVYDREKYSRKEPFYKKYRIKPHRWIEIIICFIFFIPGCIILFERFFLGWNEFAQWTGFGEYTGSVIPDNRAKTLWDWMELFFIPAILALGAIWFNLRNGYEEKERNLDRQREASLQDHIDYLSETIKILNDDQQTPPQIVKVINTKTKAVLSSLDGKRKGILIQFLNDTYLLGQIDFFISLKDADLENVNLDFAELYMANLSGGVFKNGSFKFAFLRNANLEKAILADADLESAYLRFANLESAFLRRANLKKVYMEHANLRMADLTNADLRNATMYSSDLSSAHLTGANFSNANLVDVEMQNAEWDHIKFANATMPDGKKYDPLTHTKEFLTSKKEETKLIGKIK